MFRKLLGKISGNQPSSDRFKSLIHTLSVMTEEELVKVERLLELVFDGKERSLAKTGHLIGETIQPPESSLDEQIEEARAQLKTDELEKKIEQFRKKKEG